MNLNKIMSSEKGQLSMEFIITFIIMLLIFTMAIFIYGERAMLNSASEEQWVGQKTADDVAKIVNNLHLSDDNTVYSEYIFWDFGDVTMRADVVQVFGDGGSLYTAQIIPDDVNWDLSSLNGELICEKINNRINCGVIADE